MRWRVVVVVGGVGMVSVLAGACGSGTRGAEVRTATPAALDQGYLAQVAETSTAARTGRFDVSIEMDGGGGSAPNEVAASGAFDADKGTYRQDLSMRLMGRAVDLEVVGTAEAQYERGSSFALFNLPADTWVKFSFADLGADSIAVGTASTGDPSALLDLLRGSGASIEDRGTETIDGVETRHVHTTATMKDLAAHVSGARQKELEQSLPGTRAMPDVPVELDVYIAPDDRVRRLVLGTGVSTTTGTTPSSNATSRPTAVRETVDYRDYGAAVDIVVPGDEHTVDGFALLRGLASTPGPYR